MHQSRVNSHVKPGGLRCPSPPSMPRPTFLHCVELANLKLLERKCFFHHREREKEREREREAS